MLGKDQTPGPLEMDESLVRLLGPITSDPELELEWIDLLSQLEYVGCRKIVKSVGFESVSLEILRHVSEEASHAFLLKEVAEKGGLRPRSWREGRFAEAGWNYFQRLDQGVSALPESGGLAYPGVSWAIERRVLMVYPSYLRITRNEALRRALGRILAQEERHGTQFSRLSFPPGYLGQVAGIEETLWPEFVARAQRLSASAPLPP